MDQGTVDAITSLNNRRVSTEEEIVELADALSDLMVRMDGVERLVKRIDKDIDRIETTFRMIGRRY